MIDHMEERTLSSTPTPLTTSPVLQAASLVLSLLKLFLGETEDMTAVVSALRLVLDLLDPVMGVWVVLIITAGYFLKRMDLPSWMPSLPVLLLFCYLILGFTFGALRTPYKGASGAIYILAYGVGNAILFTGSSFIIYDIAHAAVKKARAKKLAKEAEA